MDKQQFLNKWHFTGHCLISQDIEAVIANEIAKAQEVKLEDAKPQPDFNPIEEAYERWEKIRHNDWAEGDWILKYDETKCVSRNRLIQSYKLFSQKINTNPHEWEIYTEPEQPAKPFDKERFEAMFRAVYQSTTSNFDKCIEFTKENLNKLDAYYASKEGGNNG